ncbi:MAG: hypothetical protein ACPGYX_01625 [Oceanobacter sp.]
MMQFLLSRELSKLLSRQLMSKPFMQASSGAAGSQQADMIWRGDAALIGADLCIVMQEQFTQYVMVFCGVTEEELADFSEFFADRFWRETLAICDQAQLYKRELLRDQLQHLCQQPGFKLDPDFIEDGKVPKVIDKLERLFLHEREPLPIDGRSAFEFSYGINTRKPKAVGDEPIQSPAENMGNLCLNLIELQMKEAKSQQPDAQSEWVVESSDSVVTVDFAAHRRQR